MVDPADARPILIVDGGIEYRVEGYASAAALEQDVQTALTNGTVLAVRVGPVTTLYIAKPSSVLVHDTTIEGARPGIDGTTPQPPN
jgi:hypothetical protein